MSKARDDSPVRTPVSQPYVWLFIRGERWEDEKFLLLAPTDYKPFELELIKSWSECTNIFDHYVIEEEQYLPSKEEDCTLTNRPYSMEEAAVHIELWKKLEAFRPAAFPVEVEGKVLMLRICTID
jgi:hypothetical protein